MPSLLLACIISSVCFHQILHISEFDIIYCFGKKDVTEPPVRCFVSMATLPRGLPRADAVEAPAPRWSRASDGELRK